MFMERNYTISKELIELVTPAQAWRYYIVPKERKGQRILFYAKEINEDSREELQLFFPDTIDFDIIDEKVLHELLVKNYPVQKNGKVNSIQFSSDFTDFLPKIMSEAGMVGSSDIHIERYDLSCRIRFRIDGKLIERYRFEKERYPAIINRVKIQANLDIAEKRLPQDGRIHLADGNKKIDIRVSVLPTLHGEKVVLRLLNTNTADITLDDLGFSQHQLEAYKRAIQKPNGIILISGPTGSGKTTTLYASLKELNRENVNILTVEDPIEYTLDGINQVQVKEDIGLTFASALRTFLRQDPDIIMLGEIRDSESAQMAIRAALTGHLVFSTVHTNSALGTISRLIDMDIPPYLVSSTLNLSIAQRLVRLLCPRCKQEEPFLPTLLPVGVTLKEANATHFVHKGCEHCIYTGYSGRKAIYELLPVDYSLAEMIKYNRLDPEKIEFVSLKQSAIELFLKGETSLEEIITYLL
jgi:general secretion pathway protein E/type IV pilus assembly protein PilB